MLPKEKDIHNLFTPDPQSEYEVCPLDECTILKIGGKLFKHNEEFSKTKTGVSVRVEFDRWAEFHSNDFSLFGITPMRKKQLPEVTYQSFVRRHFCHEFCSDRGIVYVALPDSFCAYPDSLVEVTVRVL